MLKDVYRGLIKCVNGRRRSFSHSVEHSRHQGREHGLLLMCWCQMTCCSHLSQMQFTGFLFTGCGFSSLWLSY